MSRDEKRGMLSGYWFAFLLLSVWRHDVMGIALAVGVWALTYFLMGGFRVPSSEPT